MTTSTPDPENLLDGIDLSDIYVPADAIELAQLSILASQETPSDVAAPAEATIRLSGDGVQRNRIGARQASRIIGGLQEVLAAIGQALNGNPTSRGAIPQFIRQRTALNLFPAAAAGSVQLTLEAPIVNSTMQFSGMKEDNLADRAAAALVKLLGEVAATEFDEAVVVEHLRSLGPRVARQVHRFSSELVVDDVDFDLTWRRFAEAPEIGRLHRDKARLLRDIIRQSRVEAQVITLVGNLVTISTVRPAAIVLDSGEIVTLAVDDSLTAELVPYFDKHVQVQVEETVTYEDATGRERSKYQLITVSLAMPNQPSDEPVGDVAAE